MLFELPSFEHKDAMDVQEALSYLARYGDRAKVIAGATDLLSLMKDRIEGPKLKIPEVLVNVKKIPGLNGIRYERGKGLRIGATVTLKQLAASDTIKQKFPIVAEAALQVGTTQLRNMGTVGGNLCQRPRCSYFRHPHFICFKKGGGRCYAVSGEHRFHHAIMMQGKCVAAHPSDLAPALIALGGKAVVAGSHEERRIPLSEFFAGGNSLGETALRADELLTGVEMPEPRGTHQVFLKQRIRHAVDFALSSVALAVIESDGVCEDIRLVLGGVAPVPVLVPLDNVIKSGKLDHRLIEDAANLSIKEAHPLRMNGYKVDLTKVTVQRAFAAIAHGPTEFDSGT